MAVFLIILTVLFSSCGPDSEISFLDFPSQQEQQQEDQVIMPDTFIISGTFPQEADRTGKIFCIAQGEYLSTCTAEIDNTTGDFDCDGIYVDSPVTCFYRNSDNTETLATIEFAEDDNVTYPGYLSRSTLAISLTGSVDLGNLTYDSTNPLISTAYSNVETKISTGEANINLDTFHDVEWKMSCLNFNSSIHEKCQNEIELCEGCDGSKNVFYLRNIPLEKSSISLKSIAIWTKLANFNSCDEFDLQNNIEAELNSNGLSVDPSVNIGPWRTGSTCPKDEWLRDDSIREPGNITNFLGYFIPQKFKNNYTFYYKRKFTYDEFAGDPCDVHYFYFISIFPTGTPNEFYSYIKINKFDIDQNRLGNNGCSEFLISDLDSEYWVKLNQYESTE